MVTKNNINIAIIGAGLSGLTAGLRLYQKGYNFAIFEAHKRVSGRVFTVSMKNVSKYINVELGGHNINDGGEAKNLLALIQELGCKTYNDLVIFRDIFVFYNNRYHNLRPNLQIF